MSSQPGAQRIFDKMLARRWSLLAALLALGAVSIYFASKVRPDFSVEMAFPTFHSSRLDYTRLKHDFPFEDAHGLVVVEAADLFTPAGLRRVAALEHDLSAIPGVLDTDGPTTTKDIVSDGDNIRSEKLFPQPDLPPDELARRRAIATHDPLFVWKLAPPDGHAACIWVTISRETVKTDANRAEFTRRAREVVRRHDALAKAAGVQQKLTLSGLPVNRSTYTEMINQDFVLVPIALAVILLLLYGFFRGFRDIVAALITILFSLIFMYGAMGVSHVPLTVLNNITPIIVMVVSISDTVHIIADYKGLVGRGVPPQHAVVEAMGESAIPCLLTEITIAGGFVSLIANDMVMIQQFGLITAAAMLLTWFANVTVLPLALSLLEPRGSAPTVEGEARGFHRLVAWIERSLIHRKKQIVVVTVVITAVAAVLALRAGKEYYAYDDLRYQSPLARDLRYVETVTGGTVPMAIFIEPGGDVRKPDAMLEPAALALIDRIGQKLEQEFGADVKNATSLAKYMRKAHRLLAGEELARTSPLPTSRALAAQELLAFEEPRLLRDVLSFDRGSAAIYCVMPDKGSSHAAATIARLRAYFATETAATGYRVTLTGTYGLVDGIYHSLVGGLAGSFAVAVMISFLIFAVVLRSVRLAAIGLVPNVLPIILTFAMMTLFGIDIKPTSVIMFSITLVIADDDTIQYLSRFRIRYAAAVRAGEPDPHTAAALGTLRETGMPMFLTAASVTAGFLTLLFSQFLALANLGVLMGISLLSAVFADLFLSPLLLMTLKPRLSGPRR